MRPPLILFYLLCFFVPYSEALKTEIGPVEISLPYILAVLGLASLAAEYVLSGTPVRRWGFRLYTPALFFLLVYMMLCSLALVRIQLSPHPYTPTATFSVLEQLGRLFLSACIMLFASAVVTRYEIFSRGIKAVCISAGLVGLYGIYQVIGTVRGFYRPLIPHTAAYGVPKGMVGATRAIGTMQEPSFLAGFLCFSIVMTIMLLVGDDPLRRKLRPVMWISLGLQALCMVLTTSSGGFAALAVALVSALFLLRGRSRSRLVAVWVVIALLVTVPVLYIAAGSNLSQKLVAATLTKASQVSAFERANFVKAAVDMFADHPVIGVGPGLYDSYVRRYTSVFAQSRVVIVNNVYAELLAETGLLGFGAFMWVLPGILRSAFRRHRTPSGSGALTVGLTIALISMAVQFMAYPTFKMEFIWLIFGLVLAPFGKDGKPTPAAESASKATG